MKKKINKKKLIILGIIILFILLIVFGTKLFLYLNFLLGNDALIKLTTDKEYLSVKRNQSFELNFKASIMSNPFCKVDCNSTFEDLSDNRMLDENSFTLKTNNPFEKQYELQITKFGEGQKLLRFNLECSSGKTTLCHTDEKKIKSSILVNVEYLLSEEEELLKETLYEKLELIKESLSEQQIKILTLNELNQTEKKILGLNSERISLLTNKLSADIKLLIKRKILWDGKNYYLLKTKIGEMSVDNNSDLINETYKLLKKRVQEYNEFLNELNTTRIDLGKLKNRFIIEETQAEQVVLLIDFFNSQISLFNEKDFEEKANIVMNLKNSTKKIVANITREERTEAIIKSIDMDIHYSLLCNLTGKCYDRPSIQSRAYQDDFNLESVCLEIISINKLYDDIGKTINPAINKTGFNETINKKIFESLISKSARSFLDELPANNLNSEIIKKFLEQKNTVTELLEPENKNWTTNELIKNNPSVCEEKKIDAILRIVQLKKIVIEDKAKDLNLSFKEPKAQCCIFEICNDCCATKECTVKSTPIIFLHGHAFNKAVEADYSLESFNQLQNALEAQSYINAGSLSLYNINTIPEGLWGVMGKPISIKASYYFDVYQNAEDYYWVQTKSENIDTYTIKLNDIINIVIEKTGSEKAVVIAHSMGGLVARRYLQIFGSEKVEKLILLGTPNHGISGYVADYCSITGEKLECRDMKEESLFMNKLNREPLPPIKIYNIIGFGCDMQGEDGDGIVLKKSAFLQGAENHLIKGECKGLDLFHKELTNVQKHPDIYTIILNTLYEET
ncbi:MAG: alpha/beta fold hydrolase [Nanoarchaeota archaeon]|nr:alpha/beta hydrolase [Nanoarchaeota archaeon]MBU1030074.1 alpha/beta hydrolase [Nanoarchaeota archaeon]MBU1850651.1 alpha/beta hydrolase [Nanoarchaeota archaeon]